MFVLPLPRSAHRSASPQFSRVIDRLFDESLDNALRDTTASTQSRTPALDVSETDSAYSVVFDVPGVAREQLTQQSEI